MDQSSNQDSEIDVWWLRAVLYDGLFKRGSSQHNVFSHMFPIEIVRIEPRTVWGLDRIITSASGRYAFSQTDSKGRALPSVDASMAMTVYTYLKGSLVATTQASGQGCKLVLAPGVADMAVIVRQAPTECAVALARSCPHNGERTVAGTMKCDVCAGAHQGKLKAAHCSGKEVQNWCIGIAG
jgi:hypothetical protein